MTVLLFGLLLAGVPVTFALVLAAIATIWQGDIMPLLIVPQEMIRSINSFPLLAIPFFILAGKLSRNRRFRFVVIRRCWDRQFSQPIPGSWPHF